MHPTEPLHLQALQALAGALAGVFGSACNLKTHAQQRLSRDLQALQALPHVFPHARHARRVRELTPITRTINLLVGATSKEGRFGAKKSFGDKGLRRLQGQLAGAGGVPCQPA